MPVSAFDLMVQGILASSRPVASSFTETAANNGGTVYLQFPAVLPATQHFLAFASYETNSDHRGHLLNFENANASDGWRVDDNSSDTFANPEIDMPLAGHSDVRFVSSANYVIGDRMNMLISGTIASNVATSKVVIWDETSGTATEVFNEDSAATATSYDWDRWSPTLPGLLAGYGGQREVDGSIYRFAYWDDGDLSGAPPDISSSGVQDNFFNSSTGALVDPATSQSAYGTPIYDIYGALTVWNAGTNQGSGSDWTKQGGSFT